MEQSTTDDDEDDDESSFQVREEILEEVSQSSEGDIDSLNTGTSSHVHPVASSFNLRLPWKHESVVMELLNYYTEQVKE